MVDFCLSTHIHSSPLCYAIFLFVRYSGFPLYDASHNGKLYITTLLKLRVAMCRTLANEMRTELICVIFRQVCLQLSQGLPP